jgi:2-dehydro-3-deoxygluconokinase
VTTTPVLTIGETMVMVTPAEPGDLATAERFRLDVGGAESNVASHLVRAGVPAAWAGAVGDDVLGRRLLATLAGRGVDVSLARIDPDAPTGVYFKDPGPDGTRVLYYRRGSAASRLGPAFAEGLPLDRAPLVHLSGVTAALSASCRELLDVVLAARRATGAPVSFDVNYRPGLWSPEEAAGPLLALARACDLVFVGRDEAEVLWGRASPSSIRELLPDLRLVVKDGPAGAYVFHSGQTSFAPAELVEVVEPVGAGDAFAAGFLAAGLAGAEPAAALVAGHRAAARALASMTDY